MNWEKVSLIIAVLIVTLVAWLGRYDIIGVAAGGQGIHGIAYRLDRWTGEVVYIMGGGAGVVQIP